MWLKALALTLAACFGAPQPVTIRGYDDHAMEPFISRDGQTLFFNSRNGPNDRTDIYAARRVDDLTFDLMGPVRGANSDKLDGVPTLARDGTFGLISVRSVNEAHATIWTGRWDRRGVSDLVLQRALSPGRLPLFNMDIELSADGNRLYFTDNRWVPLGAPATSDFHLAVRENGVWRRAPEFDPWFARINTPALEYAAGISADERELYFTRAVFPFLRAPRLEIMVATRPDVASAFGDPVRIGTISGFVEAPTVAPDGALYYHAKLKGGRHRLFRAPRTCPTEDRIAPPARRS